MADRRVWWGVGALTLGIGAALLTGPATASAEEGAGSDSSHSSSSATDHDSAKSGADTSPAQRHDAKSTPDPGSTTTGSTDRTSSASDPGTPTTRTVTGQDPSGTSSLLGKAPDAKLVEFYSNHKQVTKDTPPTFLFHTKEDKAVLIRNSELFYEALQKAKVEGCKLYVEEKGPHGVGLGQKLAEKSKWPEELEAWLKERGLLAKK